MKPNRVARLVLVAAAVQLAAGNAAWAGICASPTEKAAFDSRVLQNELMVAALTCGEAARYNVFVTKFQPELTAHGKMVKSYFDRTYGKRGEHELNQFMTRLANAATMRRMQMSMHDYCVSAVGLFNAATSVEPTNLVAFASQTTFVSNSGIQSCAVQAAREDNE
jgi:hypothetical protein